MAILDKFHIIRKAIALLQLFSCIIVFTFSLILLIIGSITVALANSTNAEFYQTTDYVSGGNLLIVSGIFGIIISIIGALGAVPCLFDRQDNWNLWIGLTVLILYILVLLGIFIFEISATAWAYSKWDTLSVYLENELLEDVRMNYGIGNAGYTASVDSVQQELSCCGIGGKSDWYASAWRTNNNYSIARIPASCCSDMIPATTAAPTMSYNTTAASNMTSPATNSTATTTMASQRKRRAIFRRDLNDNSTNTTTMAYNTTAMSTTMAPEIICKKNYAHAFKVGCWDEISVILSAYTVHIAGVTIALAILQILIILVPIFLLVIVIVELRRSRSLEIK